jgi:PAS domain S-box-containing protein
MSKGSPPKANRILVIDDNPAIHDDFRKILGAATGGVTDISAAEAALFGEDLPSVTTSEYELSFASQGEDGLRLVEQALAENRPFALAFVDVRMPPGWDGVETVSRIWKVARDLQVVICTAFSDYSWEEMIRRLGKTDQLLILKKPFDTMEVHQLAAAMTSKWDLQRQQRSAMRGMETQMAGNTEELSRSLSLTQATLDATTDGILVIDQQGKITGFNRQFLEIWNLPPSLIQSKHYDFMLNSVLWQVTNPQQFNAKFRELTADLTGNSHDVVEFVDGRVFERFSKPQRVGEEIAGRVWSFRNVTEQRRAEGKIREQASLLNLAQDAIFVCEIDRRVKFWNKGCETLFEWSAAEVANRPVSEFLYSSPEVFDAAMATLLAEGEWNGEVGLRTKEGESVVVNSRWTLVRDAAGKPKSVLSINTDITERRKMEARFLRTQRLESIGTLASGIAHDLNNILSPILISAPMLREGLERKDVERLGRNIEISAQRGADIVKQLLTFGRGVEGERALVALGQMVDEVARMVKETFPRHIRIESSTPKDLWPVIGDPTHMHQVLLNLCINSRDAMNAGGTLRISASNENLSAADPRLGSEGKPGPYVLLNVADAGTGIPAAVMEKIFDPFFTTKAEGKGTGLGLSTVLGIVRDHGGFLDLKSEVGTGTTFMVFLPAAVSGIVMEDHETGGSPDGRGETILLVDDEEGVLQATAAVLENQGYRVLCSADGIEALAVYSDHQGQIDAVITDVMMPSMDGAGMTRVLRKLDRKLRIIATSGLEQDSRFEELHQLGIQAFLPKPFTSDKLLSTLRRVLDDGDVTVSTAQAV